MVVVDNDNTARDYMEAVTWAGGTPLLCSLSDAQHCRAFLDKSSGIMIACESPGSLGINDENAERALCADSDSDLSHLQMQALMYGLSRDMPILAICRGMQLLNIAFGGDVAKIIDDHLGRGTNEDEIARHQVYISPGSKMAAIIGSGGFYNTNSVHRYGIKELQKSPRLLASAYSVEDGGIEGLESPEHDWVIGVQCHPERMKEVPINFRYLFKGLVQRAGIFDA